MSDERFTLTFGGPALESGLMDVRELAPSLLATGDLIQATNRLLNGDRAQIALQVKSDFRRGSFSIDLVLLQNLIEQAKQYLQLHPGITEAKDLLETLFFYTGTAAAGGMGLFKFIKWLRGRNLAAGTITFINNGTIRIQLGEDATEVVFRLSWK